MYSTIREWMQNKNNVWWIRLIKSIETISVWVPRRHRHLYTTHFSEQHFVLPFVLYYCGIILKENVQLFYCFTVILASAILPCWRICKKKVAFIHFKTTPHFLCSLAGALYALRKLERMRNYFNNLLFNRFLSELEWKCIFYEWRRFIQQSKRRTFVLQFSLYSWCTVITKVQTPIYCFSLHQ